MDQANSGTHGGGGDGAPGAPGFSPTKVFAILLTLLVAATGAVLLTRSDPPPIADREGTPAAAAPFALTNEEAIARFKELRILAIQAVRRRDGSLLPQAFVDGTAIQRRAYREVARLRNDGVRDLGTYATVRLALVENSDDEILIREVREVSPCFVTDDGRDVTRSPAIVRQRIIWTLQRVADQWLIADSVLQYDEVTQRERGNCA